MKAARAEAIAESSRLTWIHSAQLGFLTIFILLAGVHLAFAAPPNAADFLADLRDRAVVQLSEEGISDEEKARRFTAILRESLDTESIARFVTGPTWRDADGDQRKAFMDAFEASIVARFLPLLGKDAGDRLNFDQAATASAKEETVVMVKSTVERDDGTLSKLVWRLRKTEGSYKIIDLSAEGISMAMTLRDEYSSVLNANDGDLGALARLIRKRTASQKS